MDLVVTMRPVSEIRPYEGNARRNQKTVEALKKAIQSFGFNQPILVDKEGVIIKGHARYQAACELGMAEIPCIVSERDSSVNDADRLYDNMIHDLTDWDDIGLGVEMRDIGDVMDDILGQTRVEYNLNGAPDPVSEADVARAQAKAAGTVAKSPEYVEVICPDCGEKLFLEKGQVERIYRLGQAGNRLTR